MIGESGVEHIANLINLKNLDLLWNEIGASSAEELRRKLPACRIEV
jgi:hypothetical protein